MSDTSPSQKVGNQSPAVNLDKVENNHPVSNKKWITALVIGLLATCIGGLGVVGVLHSTGVIHQLPTKIGDIYSALGTIGHTPVNWVSAGMGLVGVGGIILTVVSSYKIHQARKNQRSDAEGSKKANNSLPGNSHYKRVSPKEKYLRYQQQQEKYKKEREELLRTPKSNNTNKNESKPVKKLSNSENMYIPENLGPLAYAVEEKEVEMNSSSSMEQTKRKQEELIGQDRVRVDNKNEHETPSQETKIPQSSQESKATTINNPWYRNMIPTSSPVEVFGKFVGQKIVNSWRTEKDSNVQEQSEKPASLPITDATSTSSALISKSENQSTRTSPVDLLYNVNIVQPGPKQDLAKKLVTWVLDLPSFIAPNPQLPPLRLLNVQEQSEKPSSLPITNETSSTLVSKNENQTTPSSSRLPWMYDVSVIPNTTSKDRARQLIGWVFDRSLFKRASSNPQLPPLRLLKDEPKSPVYHFVSVDTNMAKKENTKTNSSETETNPSVTRRKILRAKRTTKAQN